MVFISLNILDGSLYSDPTHPIKITIRAPPSSSSEVTPFTPVHWDHILGRWSTGGCRYGHHIQDHVVFTCKQLGYYGLLQDITYLNMVKVQKNQSVYIVINY